MISQSKRVYERFQGFFLEKKKGAGRISTIQESKGQYFPLSQEYVRIVPKSTA